MLTLPEAPSSNRYWRKFRGHMVKSGIARDYQEAVREIAEREWPFPPAKGAVRLTIHWYRKRRSGDMSNRVKVMEDALQGILFEDDKQVASGRQERYYDPANPRMEVWVEELEEDR